MNKQRLLLNQQPTTLKNQKALDYEKYMEQIDQFSSHSMPIHA